MNLFSMQALHSSTNCYHTVTPGLGVLPLCAPDSRAAATALKPPFMARGDTLSASTFWHGSKLDEWANAWTRYYSGGKGNYMVAAMEDSGTMQALTFLNQAGRVDLQRVLVLRTVRNYDREALGCRRRRVCKKWFTATTRLICLLWKRHRS
jgi:hypothetical protein